MINESDINFYKKYKWENWFLILKNDSKNDQLKVVLSLKDNTNLSYQNCIEIMMTAHYFENSVIKTGSFTELKIIKRKLDFSGLQTSLKRIKNKYSTN